MCNSIHRSLGTGIVLGVWCMICEVSISCEESIPFGLGQVGWSRQWWGGWWCQPWLGQFRELSFSARSSAAASSSSSWWSSSSSSSSFYWFLLILTYSYYHDFIMTLDLARIRFVVLQQLQHIFCAETKSYAIICYTYLNDPTHVRSQTCWVWGVVGAHSYNHPTKCRFDPWSCFWEDFHRTILYILHYIVIIHIYI